MSKEETIIIINPLSENIVYPPLLKSTNNKGCMQGNDSRSRSKPKVTALLRMACAQAFTESGRLHICYPHGIGLSARPSTIGDMTTQPRQYSYLITS